MKRITAIVITAAAFLGCSYVGSTSAAEHAKNCPALVDSVVTVFNAPDYAAHNLLEACELGARDKMRGLPEDAATRIANHTKDYPFAPMIGQSLAVAYLAGYKAGN